MAADVPTYVATQLKIPTPDGGATEHCPVPTVVHVHAAQDVRRANFSRQRLVGEVVGVLPAELVEGLGDLRLLRRHEVGPRRAVGERDGRLEHAVGVDGVPAAEEEVGFEVRHRPEDPVTAA